MILLIDNYDSFVHNLARYVAQLGEDPVIVRNNSLSISDIKSLKPTHIIISPGPCTPNEAGISLDVIHHFHQTIPILGICLGHQAIGQYFRGSIQRAKQPKHGKSTLIDHAGTGLFRQIPSPLKVGLYHSLIVNPATLQDEVEVTATSPIGEVMALQHRHYPVTGLQFHPESILSNCGYELLRNFLNR